MVSSLLLASPVLADPDRSFTLQLGERDDYLNWHIAGNGVNVLSDLTWRDVRSTQLQAEFTGVSDGGHYAHLSGSYGVVRDGANRDSDYDGPNRTLEFSRSYSDVTGDDVWDLSIAIGKEVPLDADGRMAAIPVIGWSHHRQNFRVRNGVQIIPDLGPFSGLNTTYATEWSGPWLGLHLRLGQLRELRLLGRVEWHWVDYTAQANWNLRTDFAHPVSFEHSAGGDGLVASLGVRAPLGRSWAVGLTYDYQRWQTGRGTDVIYFSDGSVGITRLNEVIWRASALSLAIEYLM